MGCDLEKISSDAKARFAEIPFPHKKDEYWRFADLDAWGADALFPHFAEAAPKSSPSGKLLEIESKPAEENRVSIFDGQVVAADISGGACAMRAERAAKLFPLETEKFYTSLGGKFSTIAAARAQGGAAFVVPAGASAKFELNIVSKLGLSVSSVLFILGENSKLSLTRNFAVNEKSFAVSAMKFALAKNASLELATFKYSAKSSRAYLRDDFDLSEGAAIADALAELGVSPSRTERNFEILGEGAALDSRAFIKAGGEVAHDLRTSQMHRAGGSQSNLAVKAAAGGRARIAFAGLVRVEPEAQKTKAYQSCKSLSLSDEAKTQASPILEIMANDVECSHGCSVSKPDAEEVFYMNQRGLSEADALDMIARGFAQNTFEKLGIEFEG